GLRLGERQRGAVVGEVGQAGVLLVGELVEPRRQGERSGWNAAQRVRPGQLGPVEGAVDRGRSAVQRPAQDGGQLIDRERGRRGGQGRQDGAGVAIGRWLGGIVRAGRVAVAGRAGGRRQSHRNRP